MHEEASLSSKQSDSKLALASRYKSKCMKKLRFLPNNRTQSLLRFKIEQKGMPLLTVAYLLVPVGTYGTVEGRTGREKPDGTQEARTESDGEQSDWN
jgi:hypothetical protein